MEIINEYAEFGMCWQLKNIQGYNIFDFSKKQNIGVVSTFNKTTLAVI